MRPTIRNFLRYFGSGRRKRQWNIRAIVLAIFLFLMYVLFYSVLLDKLSKIESRDENNGNMPEEVFPQKRTQLSSYNTTEVKLMPWEPRNFHQIPNFAERPQSGPGELGQGVDLTPEEQTKADESMKKWFMNVVARLVVSLKVQLSILLS